MLTASRSSAFFEETAFVINTANKGSAMKILVTGCNGFIGKNMISYLTQATDWKIEGWSWDPDPTNWPKIVSYDWVIHLGAETTSTDVELVLEKNFDFSQWLFTECQKHGVHLQYASSHEVYGQSSDLCESAQCAPMTPVAWSKYLFDRWAFKSAHTAYVQGFRYFNVYGKWMHTKGHLFDSWRTEAKLTGKIVLTQHAEHIKRDWVWVGDICRVHLDFIRAVNGSGIWNVGSGLIHSDYDIADEIAETENAEVVVIETNLNVKHQHARPNLLHLKETIGKRKWLNVYEWINTE